MTEYLYDRDNPKSHFRQRISGIQGLFYGVPNINERADMIGRYLIYFQKFNMFLIEHSLRRQMVISLSLLWPQESPVIWHRSGEHSRILLDSSKIPLAISTGKYSPSISKTASVSSGFCSFSTSTSLSYSGS